MLSSVVQTTPVRRTLAFKSVLASLLDGAELPPNGVSNLDYLRSLSVIPSAQIAAARSPFVAQSVHVLGSELALSPRIKAHSLEWLLMCSFDALFANLDVGQQIEITRSDDISLPYLGLEFRSEGPLVLSKHSDRALTIITPDGTQVIEIGAVPTPFRAKTIRFPQLSGAGVLVSTSNVLFDEACRRKILADCGHAETIAAIGGDALAILMSLPHEFLTLLDLLTWVVPIDSTDPHVHCSFTSAKLDGVVFLSKNTTAMGMAEALVHELSHSELNLIAESYDLFGREDPARLFYSPWRSDPRPFSGLLHALHVFSRVLRMYDAAVDCAECDQATALERGDLIAHRLMLGLEQLRNFQLSDAAANIIGSIRATAEDYVERHHPSKPPVIDAHLRAWTGANPGLSAYQ